MSEVWTQWEGQTIDGAHPLRRCLGVSDHSGVFLTEDPAHSLTDAALKLVPAIPTLAESQLAYWSAAAALSHPRLLRLFSTGRCQLGSLHCLYVVMEYAEQNLAQFLTNRSLSESEVLELLPQTLAGLAFLHSRGLVHGHLKPSNILVVGDQLKLASDTVRPAGEAATSISMLSAYDPPEARDGSFSTAGDVWALGVTVYEALTRTTPAKPDERSHGVVLPPDFPPGCAEIVRECLSRRPDDRPSLARLQAWVTRPTAKPDRVAQPTASGSGSTQPATPPVSSGQPVAPSTEPKGTAAPAPGELPMSADRRAAVTPERASKDLERPKGRLTIRAVVEPEPPPPPERRSFVPIALAAVAVIAALCWVGVRLFTGNTSRPPGIPQTGARPPEVAPAPAIADSGEPSASSPESRPHPPATDAAPPQGEPPKPAEASPSPTVPAKPRHPTAGQHSGAPTPRSTPSVVHEEIPNVPRSALATIHGHVRVSVQVNVDTSGAVVDESLLNPGPSRYFARVAMQAARKWKFNPVADGSPRQCVLHFEFSRGGTKARASA